MAETSKLTKPFSPSFDATSTPAPPLEYATLGRSPPITAVRHVSHPAASAIVSFDHVSPFGVASWTLPSDEVDV